MSEVETTTPPAQTATPFSSNAWNESVPTTTPSTEVATTVVPPVTTPLNTETTPATTTEPPKTIYDNEWFKKEFNWETPEAGKTEIEALRKLKETPPTPAEIKFENEQSKHIHELIRSGKTKEVKQFLETQEQLETITALEINKDNAADVIKLNMKLKHPNLSKEQIDFQYNEEYVAGKEPVQKATETDEDFEERHNEWKERANRVEMKRTIAATMAIPELQAAKAKLVLPEINAEPSAPKPPTQEELDRFKKEQDDFMQKSEAALTAFTGFNVNVKDEDVDYSVNYALSPEEKTLITNKVKTFVESGFDANSIFAESWVMPDGKTLNADQMIKDLSRFFAGDKVHQKIATDSANQRIKEHMKKASNVTLNNSQSTSTQTFQPIQTQQQNATPFSANAWSEKLPVTNN